MMSSSLNPSSHSDLAPPLPAHETKHLPVLNYAFPELGTTFTLNQTNDSGSTGSSLWLSAQVLACYLCEVYPRTKGAARTHTAGNCSSSATTSTPTSTSTSTATDPAGPAPGPSRRRRRAIDLGAGVGMLPLLLSRLGWDVLATDIEPPLSSVLRPNVRANLERRKREVSMGMAVGIDGVGDVQVRKLDWTQRSEEWSWEWTAERQRGQTVGQGQASDNQIVEQGPAQNQDKYQAGNSTPTPIAKDGFTDKRTPQAPPAPAPEPALAPPFDMILSADTLYHPSLSAPLLRTIRALCLLSSSESSSSSSARSASDPAAASASTAQAQTQPALQPQPRTRTRLRNTSASTSTSPYPPVLLALERRDPFLIDSALSLARENFGFDTTRVPARKVRKAVDRHGGKHWSRESWEGVEIWELRLMRGEMEIEMEGSGEGDGRA